MGQAWTAIVMKMMMLGSTKSFLLHTPTVARHTFIVGLHSTSTSTTVDRAATDMEPALPQRIPGCELLSLDLDGLGEVLGGSGRARMVWAALADGVDPFCPKDAIEFLTPKTAQLLTDAFAGLPWQVCSPPLRGVGCNAKLLCEESEVLLSW